MSSKADSWAIYIALVLAAVAAVMTAPSNAGEADKKVEWLLLTIGGSESAAMAGAIGENPEFAVPP
jgi:hypothetical protein